MTALPYRRVFGLVLTAALMSAPAFAQHVDVDYDRTVNFKAYKTYAFGTVTMPEDANPLMLDRIRAAIDGQMAQIGFRKVEKNPDVRIAIIGSSHEELSYTSWGDFGPYWGAYPYWGGVAYPFWWSSGFSGYDVQRILVGTLTLDVIDAKTDRVVFRGTAEDTVSHKARKNERKAYESVSEIFEESPWGRDFDGE